MSVVLNLKVYMPVMSYQVHYLHRAMNIRLNPFLSTNYVSNLQGFSTSHALYHADSHITSIEHLKLFEQ